MAFSLSIQRCARRSLSGAQRSAMQLLTLLALLPLTAAAAPTVITEFYNATLRHYVLITAAAEVAAIEAGAAGPGWQKTGRTIFAHSEAGDAPGLVPVCRFYGSITPGPNSHFFTADPAECAAVKADPGWHYEGIAFYVKLADDGDCDADRTPVWRAYNNGFRPQQGINDGNHRFATDHALTRKLADFGWSDEGIVFCAMASAPSAPFEFALSSVTRVLLPGATRDVFFSLAARNGFAGAVTLSATGLPAGVSAQFIPPVVTLAAQPVAVTMRLVTAASAAATAEDTNVTINGVAANASGFTGFTVGIGAATDPVIVQAQAMAEVEAQSRALRLQGLKGLAYVQGIAAFMGAHPAYASAGVDATSATAWGWFKDGTLHVVTDNLERPSAAAVASAAAMAAAGLPGTAAALPGTSGGLAVKAGGEVPGTTKARLSQVFGANFVGQRPISDMRRFLRSKGWSLRSGADADAYVSSLKTVGGDGFFYLNSHGTVVDAKTPVEPDGLHLVWTATLAEPLFDRVFANDLALLRLVRYTARNFLEPDGAPPLEDTRYAFTYRFVKEYMRFEDSSVVFMNACWSGQATNPATVTFVKAFNDAGAGVYLGWTHLLDFDTAFLAAPWFVDRMVGANLHFDKESPPQRAFPYDLVVKDMARKGIDASLVTPAKLLAWPKAGLKYPPILAPSIKFARVNEYAGELVLTGEFGERPPKVTVGGTTLALKSNSATEIVANLPLNGAGSNGDVVVEVRNVKSNARQLSEWRVPFEYNWIQVADIPEFNMGGSTTLRLRADIGRYRLLPHETPHFTKIGGPPTPDSTLVVTASGTHIDPGCSATLAGTGTYRTPAAPPSTGGAVLANFFSFDAQTKDGSIGLSFGEFTSAHTITLTGPNCGPVGTVPMPVVLGLLEGTVDFPRGQQEGIDTVPLPAARFTLDANWGIPSKRVIDLGAGGEINVFWPPVPAIVPPRDTVDSGK